MDPTPRNLIGSFVAAILFVAFAGYLYLPHGSRLAGWQWLLPVNACVAAFGAYVLSRRWTPGVSGAILAGLLYGFGPFLLGLAKAHPLAGLPAACVPWLFVPATLAQKRFGKAAGLGLLVLPFAAILLFSRVSASQRFFAAPLQTSVRPTDLAGFVAPLALIPRNSALVGLYHVPMAALVLGLAMMGKARRYSLLGLVLVGFVLAFSKTFLSARQVAWLGVSPILWLSIPLTGCAVLAGIGLHGLIAAGYADRKWILAATIVLGGLAIAALLLAAHCFQVILGLGDGYARLFVEAAKAYLLGVVATGIVFGITHSKLRLHALRWAILCVALAVDIFLGARYIVDRLL
ncbi:MAG TPA: hypothetical protein PK373_03325 [Sedimentisphaerales bacterium]|nr:hypothetical protein [Phycisphaerae bacterium]HON92252.1 hypothetical protein [Sedimentisphaerales bacterium]HQG48096.1 hypothetical protein [Sedimentisphaerales bacterium]